MTGMDLDTLLVLGMGGHHWQLLAQQLSSGQPQLKASTQQPLAQQQLESGQKQALGEQAFGEQALQALQVLLLLQRQVFGKGSSGSLAAFQGDLKLAAVLRAMLRTVAVGQRT